MSENNYYIAFSNAPGIGPKRFEGLVRQFGSAIKAWEALGNNDEIVLDPELKIGKKTLTQLQEFVQKFDCDIYTRRLEKSGVVFLSQISNKYPQELLKLPNPPIGLFVRGDITCLATKKFGIVGTRKVTSYGRDVTELFASQLVQCNYTIVSGLALGIDAIAHKITLDHKGKTIAVLGCGVDCCNPHENQRLYTEILESNGLIISEYPLGAAPTKGSFPARNRIIAALSEGVLVPEAGADSGSLITADWARKLQRPIFAVPGPITSRQSDGTSYLLKSGAHLVQSAQDISKIFGLSEEASTKPINIDILEISGDEKSVLKLMLDEEKSFDELVRGSNFSVSMVGMILGNLELSGYIIQRSNGTYSIAKA
jgi:DNA processing protein